MNQRNIIIAAVSVAVVVLVWVFFPKGSGEKGVDSGFSAGAATPSQAAGAQAYQQALTLVNNGEFVKAKEAFEGILVNNPDFEQIEEVQENLENTNMKLIFSNTLTPKAVLHEVQSGDTLGALAKKYGTTVDLIKISNNLKSDTIRVGQKIRVWTGTFNIFVDKSQNILLLKDGDEVVKVYRVSTGTNNSTPIGDYTITTKLVDPVWFKSGAIVPPESPENVLGTRWMGFDLPGYGIHGTVEPETIGQQVTAGCVRMINTEVEELFSIVPRGTKVTIVN